MRTHAEGRFDSVQFLSNLEYFSKAVSERLVAFPPPGIGVTNGTMFRRRFQHAPTLQGASAPLS